MYLIQPNMDVLLLNVSCLILHQNHHNFNKTDIFHDHSLHCKTFNVFNSTRKRFIKISLHPLLVKIWEKTSTQSKFKTCYIHDFLQISQLLGKLDFLHRTNTLCQLAGLQMQFRDQTGYIHCPGYLGHQLF